MPEAGLHRGRAWQVRRATIADRDATLALLQRAFGGDPTLTVERWNWLFVDNPSRAPLQYWLADTGTTLAGQYAVMPIRIQHAGKPMLALLSLDTGTDPAFERQGVLTTLALRLYDEASAIAPLVYGFPNPKSAPVLYQKLGWVELRPFPLLARPLRGMSRLVGKPWLRALDVIEPVLRAATAVDGSLARLRGARVVELDGFGPWADELWTAVAPRLGTCAIRDRAFLEWRFCRAPHRYRIRGLQRDGRIVGFAVSRVHPWRGERLARLMELLVHPDDAVGARALLADVIAHASAERAVALHAVVGHTHPHRREMFRAGLLPVPARVWPGQSFGARINGPGVLPDKALHASDWYISGADMDFY